MSNKSITLSIYPNTYGFGYVCLEDSKTLLRYGVAGTRPLSNDELMKRLNSLVLSFAPTVLVVRGCQDTSSKMARRSREFVNRIQQYARVLEIPVFCYTRRQVKETFSVFGATTKQEIAESLTNQFPELKPYLPRKRKSWECEDYSMGIFDALALIGTHTYLS